MSSVGFVGKTGNDLELQKLREAYDSLKDVMRGIASAQACIDRMNFGMATDHLKAALWHAGEAKKAIAVVGQAKTKHRSA
jgi:DNA-binding FrmR family transcriptional regulator